MSDLSAPQISRELFGGVFDIDGAGHYPGLELINFIVSSQQGILPDSGEVLLARVAHDFARRLIRDEDLPESERRAVLIDDHSEKAVSRLLKCLELETPNVVKAKSWGRTHFFPYTRSLVHWDARARSQAGKTQIQIERQYYRGGGAYAFSVLRADEDKERLGRVRAGFASLYPTESEAPLDLLAEALKNKGAVASPAPDQIESESRLFGDKWEQLYRVGIDNILGHKSTSSVERVRAIVNWTGLWLVFAVAGRSAESFGVEPHSLVTDCAGIHPQLRRASQRCYKEQISIIEKLAVEKARNLGGSLSEKQLGKIRGFFGNTSVACGLGNAWKGRRHFMLRLDALETLVMAGLSPQREIEFERFVTEWLFEGCGLVVGRSSADKAKLLKDLDATIFEENERYLAAQMQAAGMLKVYSDATRMVSIGTEK